MAPSQPVRELQPIEWLIGLVLLCAPAWEAWIRWRRGQPYGKYLAAALFMFVLLGLTLAGTRKLRRQSGSKAP